jgi:hypothetical protein
LRRRRGRGGRLGTCSGRRVRHRGTPSGLRRRLLRPAASAADATRIAGAYEIQIVAAVPLGRTTNVDAIVMWKRASSTSASRSEADPMGVAGARSTKVIQ